MLRELQLIWRRAPTEYGAYRRKIQQSLTSPLTFALSLTNGNSQVIIPQLTDRATLDSAGRIVIPKGMRDELQLEPGDSLTVESDGERVTLRPVRPHSPMRKKNGSWVFHAGGEPITTEEANQVLEEQQRARERMFIGLKK